MPDPMTPAELAEIRQRCHNDLTISDNAILLAEDIPRLLAEIDRLNGMLDRICKAHRPPKGTP